MKTQSKATLKDARILLLSFFGVGFLPKAPGTWGSIASLPLLYFFCGMPWPVQVCTVLGFTAFFSFLADPVEKAYGVHDPSWIVIDEVLGMMTAAIWMGPWSIPTALAVLGLFRLFDIWKPWPCSWIDERINNGFGTMLDDIAAGLYAGLVIFIVRLFVH